MFFTKKNNNVLVVLVSILFHFVKTAILWVTYTNFAIENWQTINSTIEKIFDRDFNWDVKIIERQIVDPGWLT